MLQTTTGTYNEEAIIKSLLEVPAIAMLVELDLISVLRELTNGAGSYDGFDTYRAMASIHQMLAGALAHFLSRFSPRPSNHILILRILRMYLTPYEGADRISVHFP